jgi:hypothetical protein
MKAKIIYIFWGIVFFLAGVGLLAGFIDLKHLSQQVKLVSLTIAAAGFILTYFLDGIKKWGWLFPALFCAAMALTMWMSTNNMEDSPLTAISILASFALPFYVGFACEPKRRGLLVPPLILTLVMILIMSSESDYDYEGTVVMSLFALSFFVAYFWSKKNWWAFIPGGVFATIGLVALLEGLAPHKEYAILPNTMHWGVYNWVLFLGFAATFGAPWLRRKTQPTDWTKYPALGFLSIATVSFILGERFQEYWLATMMLVIGGLFLMATFIKMMPSAGQRAPEIKA